MGERRRTLNFAWLMVAVARGAALFMATYALCSLIAMLLGSQYNRDLWWIDITMLPNPLIFLLQALLIAVLYAFAFHVPRSMPMRVGGALVCAAYAAFALMNVASVLGAVREGSIRMGVPLPFSLFIALAFMLMAACVAFGAVLVPKGSKPQKAAAVAAVGLSAVLAAVLFPLGQIVSFGTTTYLAPADACVVLGAQVQPDGTPSKVLQDRLDTAIALYNDGQAGMLVMSGGIDVDGVSEAEAMKDYAVASGVPAESIIVDPYGNSTIETAHNTAQIFQEHGFQRISAVSNYYHLARIKMLYLTEGVDVITVPAHDVKSRFDMLAVLREVPGWWFYWFKTLV